jgi:hypothetical protein
MYFVVVGILIILIFIGYLIYKTNVELSSIREKLDSKNEKTSENEQVRGQATIFDEVMNDVDPKSVFREYSPYPKLDEAVLQYPVYLYENKWINETATHSLKELKKTSDAESVVLIVICKFAMNEQSKSIRLVVEDPFSKMTTNGFKGVPLEEAQTWNNKLIILKGNYKQGKFHVTNVQRTRYLAS